MTHDVVCLRPEADFVRVGVTPPEHLSIRYASPADAGLPGLLQTARALVIPAVGPKLPPALFQDTRLALVQVTGAGVDRLDEPTLRGLGIPVANVPGGSNAAVAEYVVTAASMLLRRLAWADAEIRAGSYTAFRGRMVSENLAGLGGLTVGIVGLGTIGLAVARAFQAFGCKLVYFDPAPRDPDAVAALAMTALPLDGLLAACDVVTLHVPLLDATRNLIGASELARMKPGAVLVNAARGGVVDEAALAETLRAGHLGGCAVDVYTTEPPPASHPLLALEGDAARRILFTPHIAGVTLQASQFLFRAAWENVARVLGGAAPANRVY